MSFKVTEIPQKNNSWISVFEQLEKDKERLLRQTLTINGKKRVFEKEKFVIYLGDIRCELNDKGWKFYV